MSNLSLSEAQIKSLMKEAIWEVFQERRDIFQDLISEALEDFALAKAIDEGKASPTVDCDTIFAILEQPE